MRAYDQKTKKPAIDSPAFVFVVRPERFELPTPKFVAWCSIQLSYGRSSGIVQNRRRFRQLFISQICVTKSGGD